ncbi:MAG: adenosylmethionine decarboxylase [Myxococcota bacterium]
MHHPTVSQHVLLELFDCDVARADDPDAVRAALHAGAQALRTPVLGEAYHRFAPHGVSGVVLVAASHLSCHTWPEAGYVSVDVYSCGDVPATEAVEALVEAFGARTWASHAVTRGLCSLAPERSAHTAALLLGPGAERRPIVDASPAALGERAIVLREHGLVEVTGLVGAATFAAVRAEALRLLETDGERRDLHLATTGTDRHITVVRSEALAANPVVAAQYRDPALRAALEALAGERLHDCPRPDEELLVTRHHCRGDTHGWHWGDFSYALIWILEAPPASSGGLLQCVPHTAWDKADPRVLDHLVAGAIRTYHFGTGQLYLLRTDTTLHRTVPLTQDDHRVILNMTFAADRDLQRAFRDDDRWWDDAAAPSVAVPDAS